MLPGDDCDFPQGSNRSLRTEVSVAGKRNFQGGDKAAETAVKISEDAVAETKPRLTTPPIRGCTSCRSAYPGLNVRSASHSPTNVALSSDLAGSSRSRRSDCQPGLDGHSRIRVFQVSRTGIFSSPGVLSGRTPPRLAETKRPKRPWRFKDAGAETKSRQATPPIRG